MKNMPMASRAHLNFQTPAPMLTQLASFCKNYIFIIFKQEERAVEWIGTQKPDFNRRQALQLWVSRTTTQPST